MKWAVMGRLAKSLLGIATVSVLSYFVTPAEFGSFFLIIFITAFAQLLVDAGLGAALVQRKEITDRQKDTVFWSSLALAMAVAGVIIWQAEGLARLFDAPQIAPFIRAIAIVFPLTALQCVSMSELQRRFDFKRIAASDFIAAAFGAATAISLAYMGWTIGALVAQQIVQGAATTVIICALARWWPRLRFSVDDFKSLMSYAFFVMMTSITGFLQGNLDRIIVAGALSPEILGFYMMGKTIVTSPFKIIIRMARKVLFPILSSVQDDVPRVGRAYLRVQFALCALMMPVYFGIAAIADPLVGALLAPNWELVAPIIQLLSLGLVVFPIKMVNQTTLASLGYAKFQFQWTLMTSVVTLGTFWYATRWGLETALIVRVIVGLILMPGLSAYTLYKLGLRWVLLPQALAAPIIAAGAMFAAIAWGVQQMQVADVLKLFIFIPCGGVIYTAILFALAPGRCRDLLNTLLKRGAK